MATAKILGDLVRRYAEATSSPRDWIRPIDSGAQKKRIRSYPALFCDSETWQCLAPVDPTRPKNSTACVKSGMSSHVSRGQDGVVVQAARNRRLAPVGNGIHVVDTESGWDSALWTLPPKVRSVVLLELPQRKLQQLRFQTGERSLENGRRRGNVQTWELPSSQLPVLRLSSLRISPSEHWFAHRGCNEPRVWDPVWVVLIRITGFHLLEGCRRSRRIPSRVFFFPLGPFRQLTLPITLRRRQSPDRALAAWV